MKKGLIIGGIVGIVALVVGFMISTQCLSYRISSTIPQPWQCANSIDSILTFPIGLFTNDVSQAALFAPLTLIMYAAIGAVIGSLFSKKES